MSCKSRMPHPMPNATAAAFQPIQVRQADLLFPEKPETRIQPSSTLAGLVVRAIESALNVRVHGLQRRIDALRPVQSSIEIQLSIPIVSGLALPA